MRYGRDWIRRATVWTLAVTCWLSTGGEAWAQQTGGGRGPSPWVLPYALVLLGVGLGLLVLCKPSRRREKAKIEQ